MSPRQEIHFSENVTGVDVSDFTLTQTNVTGASIGTLTAVDAKTYQLQVNTGSESGAVGLNLVDNDSIKNALNVPLGGTGTGNGNLTGQVYNIDKTPPTGSLNAVTNIMTAGGISQTLTVIFSDNNAVDVSSLDSSDILINWSGSNIPAQFVSVDPNINGTPRTATYSFTAPGGSWDNTDNGTYTVNLQGSQVKDSLSNLAVASSLGTFSVNIAPTPTPAPSPTPVTNNIPNDDCICDTIPYPNLNQPNSVENPILGVSAIQIGTAQNEEFIGSNTGNIFDAKSGNDNLYGGSGYDILNGNKGNDFISGGSGDELLFGDEGNDIIIGDFGNDLIFGGKGNDSLSGSEGNDIIFGNRNDDFIDGSESNDTLYGGKGDDMILASEGDDYLFGNEGNDTICGGVGEDLIRGNEGADILGGCEGNDTLYGGEDNDTLTGCQGDDIVYGDLGNDSLIGGSGNDIFVLEAERGFDVIADFTLGQDLMGLAGGLSFNQLAITQNTQGTIIKNLLTGEELGIMIGVSANLITAVNFRQI